MRRKLTLTILQMAFMISYLPIYAQNRLGLHYTQEELVIWKQRIVSGPYRVKNDAQANSPGDWDRITTNAKAFLANPMADRYSLSCYKGSGCVPNLNEPGRATSQDPTTVAELLRDAGFYFLITGDARYAAAVRTVLLAEASNPLLDFTNTSRWCPGGLLDLNPGFIISEWLTRALYGYDYIKSTLSEADKAKLNAWFLGAATYMRSNYDPDLDGNFVNRATGNYTISQSYMLKKEADPSDGRSLYYGGPKARVISRIYSNRRASMASFVGLAGVFLDNASLTMSGKRFFKELIMFGIYPCGYYVDFLRGSTSNPEKGYAYSTQGNLFTLADAMARKGDTELYDFSTTAGTTATTSGKDASSDGVTVKSLRMHIKAMLDLRNHVKNAYAVSNSTDVGKEVYRIDGVTPGGSYSVWDAMYSLPNIYYKDSYIRTSYLRTAAGSIPYPSNAQSAGAAPAWTMGQFPGLLLMYGQMEGKVWPYPTKNINQTASVTPAGSLNFCEGGSVVLQANTGANYGYQWRNNGVNIPNATGATYTATASGNYSVEISSGALKLNPSTPITVTVSKAITPILSASGSTTFCSGGSVTLRATSGTNFTYQWQKDGVVIAGATNPEYAAKEAGTYVARVTQSGCASNVTNALKVTVNSALIPVITAAGNTAFCEGGGVVLKASIGTGISYRWKKDGVIIPNATSADYTATGSGNYSVETTQNACQPTLSNAVSVTVNKVFQPTITSDGNNSLCEGSSLVLSAPAGTGMSYQWQKDGVKLPQATLPTLQVAEPGAYAVTVTQNGCGSALSNAINVTTSSLVKPQAVISPLGSTNICAGSSVTLQANTGTGLTYQWRFNGQDIAQATGATYQATQSGEYLAKVTQNNCQSTLSNVVPVAVASLTSKPVITVNGNTTLDQGGSVTLSTNESSGLTYQWKKDNHDIAAATTATYQAKEAGTYSVVVTLNNCQSSASEAVVIRVNTPTPTPDTTKQQVVSFTLVNADTDEDIQTINSGSSLNLAILPSRNLNIRANCSTAEGKVGKVVFHLSGQQTHDNTEMFPPYALFRDSLLTNYRVWTPAVGNYTLEATPYSADIDSTRGKSLAISFTIVDGLNQAPVVSNAIANQQATVGIAYHFSVAAITFSDPEDSALTYLASLPDNATLPEWLNFNATTRTFSGTPPTGSISPLTIQVTASDGELRTSTTFSLTVNPAPIGQQVVSFTLVNADKDEDVQTLRDGAILNLASLPTRSLNIVASTSSEVESVVFNLSGQQTRTFTESVAPYALVGDKNGNYNSWVPAVGTFTLKATPFSANGGSGNAGTALTITFTVIDDAANQALVLTNAIPNQHATVGVAYSFNFRSNTFSNPSGSALTYSASLSDNAALPAWLSFNADTRTFSGTAPSGSNSPLSIQVTASNGKQQVSTTFSLTVNAEPQPAEVVVKVSGQTTFCEGGSVVLTAPKGYEHYLWSNGATSRKIKVRRSGNYTVKVFRNNSTRATSAIIKVDVVLLPQEPLVTLVKGNLVASPSYSYQWVLNGQPISGAVQQSYTPLTTGSYTVLVGNSGGCASASKPYSLTQLPDPTVAELSKNKPAGSEDVITAYPNPSQDVVNVSLDIDDNTGMELTLITPMGKHVHSHFAKYQREGKINLASYPSGIYYLKVVTKDKTYFKRVLKQ